MTTVYTQTGHPITLGDRLGDGAEGIVFATPDSPDVCVKLYFESKPDVEQRLGVLLGLPPHSWSGDTAEHMHVAWPYAVIYDAASRVDRTALGFLMPLVHGVPLGRLFDPGDRARSLDSPTWRTLCTICARVARLFDMLHDVGIVVGDTSPNNILVTPSGHVTLIDCDAVQFRDPATGTIHSVTKLTPSHSPPQQGTALTELTHDHDHFGLAIMVCQLLMEGQHPFEGVPTDPAATAGHIPDNIRAGRNRIGNPGSLMVTDELGLLPVEVLPPGIRVLAAAEFRSVTANGGRVRRQDRGRWENALRRAGHEITGCRNNDRHFRHRSVDSCVWCERKAAGHGDAYPPGPPAPPSAGPLPLLPKPAAPAPPAEQPPALPAAPTVLPPGLTPHEALGRLERFLGLEPSSPTQPPDTARPSRTPPDGPRPQATDPLAQTPTRGPAPGPTPSRPRPQATGPAAPTPAPAAGQTPGRPRARGPAAGPTPGPEPDSETDSASRTPGRPARGFVDATLSFLGWVLVVFFMLGLLGAIASLVR